MRLFTARILAGLGAVCLLHGCERGGDADAYLRSAQIAIAAGEYDAASLALNNVLQARPEDVNSRLQLARVALVAGRPGLAERQARAATRAARDSREGKRLLCASLLELGDFNAIIGEFIGATSAELLTCRGYAYLHMAAATEAQQLFRDALAAAPDASPPRIGLAQSELAQGDATAARRRLLDVLDDDPFSIAAHNALGALHAQLGQYSEAQLAFIDAVGLPHDLNNASDHLQARAGLAEMNWRLGDKQRALAETRELLVTFASHPLPKYLRALLAYEDGEYALASEYLRGVLAVLPDHQPSQHLSAAADLAQGRIGSAQIHITSEDSASIGDPTLRLLLSRIYMGMGNAGEAAAVMDSIDPRYLDAGALAHYATALAHAGDLPRALDNMQRAVAVAPTDIDVQIRYAAMLLQDGQLGPCDELMAGWPTTQRTQKARSMLRLLRFLRAGDLDRAQAYAKRRRREDPSELIALLALAEAAEQRGARDQAISWLEVARERNPGAVEPRFLLADYARRGGEPETLRTLAEEILAALPFNSRALELLGEAHLDAGNTVAAIETLREAHRVAPSSIPAVLSLVRSQLASGDFWQVRRDIKRAIVDGTLPPSSLQALIIEEYRRGNSEQAHALAEDLTAYFGARPLGARVLGDLHLLAGEFSEAFSAYSMAQTRSPSRIVAVKATTAAVAGRLDDPAAAIEKWLQESPTDKQLRRVLAAARASDAGPL